MAFTEVPLQIDLFTGDLVDTRTAEQKRRDAEVRIPTQLLMFSQREIAQIGVSPTPRMDLSPGRLALIAEDPRTDEEKERDRLQAAQKQTLDLFAASESTASFVGPTDFTPPDMTIKQLAAEEESDEVEDETLNLPTEPPLTKLAAYYALITEVQDATVTQAASEPILLAQNMSVSLATYNAKRAGLTEAEITAAQVIGSFRSPPQAEPSTPTTPVEEPITPVQSVITPNPESINGETNIPILWVKRSDLLKRRPDLAAEINRLSDDELAFLAKRVRDALEEFYWIQLNVVLSLFLDHPLTLHLDVPKRNQTRQKMTVSSPNNS